MEIVGAGITIPVLAFPENQREAQNLCVNTASKQTIIHNKHTHKYTHIIPIHIVKF